MNSRRYHGGAPADDAATLSYEDLQRHLQRGRTLRSQVVAGGLARGGRWVKRVLAGLMATATTRAPGGGRAGARWRYHAGPSRA